MHLKEEVPPVVVQSALVTLTVPAHTVLVLKPQPQRDDGYSPYKRVR